MCEACSVGCQLDHAASSADRPTTPCDRLLASDAVSPRKRPSYELHAKGSILLNCIDGWRPRKNSPRMTSAEAKVLIPRFIDFAKTLAGDEKSDAQIFLDRLFKALGHAGANHV